MDSTNTPVYVIQKTKEEADREMKETTKRELENLSKVLKERADKPLIVEEFLVDTDSDDNDSIITESTSNSTRDLLSAISDIKKNEKNKKSKRQHKLKNKNNLVENAVMVQKLKNEIEKLESRIRYKDLDMSNLNVEIINLQKTVDKYNFIEKIMKNFEEKELFLIENHRRFNNIIDIKDKSQKLIRLNDIKSERNQNLVESVDKNFKLEDNISQINNKILLSLITLKDNQLNSEFNQFKNKITTSIENTKNQKMGESVMYLGYALLMIWFSRWIYINYF
jgi:hypothetical protein